MTRKPLSAAQLLILRTASQRSDAAVLPLPADLKVRGAALNRLLGALITCGWIKEVKASANRPAWRQAEDGQRFALRLTTAGKSAAHAADESLAPADDLPNIMPSAADAGIQREAPANEPKAPRGKLGDVAAAVATDAGATLAELVALTGWQAHTARAALTGLRQRGFPIRLTDQEGRKAYRIGAGD